MSLNRYPYLFGIFELKKLSALKLWLFQWHHGLKCGGDKIILVTEKEQNKKIHILYSNLIIGSFTINRNRILEPNQIIN